jgi:DNA-directed RNA polymerase sigma subunit (sigma70/sigma32)
MSNHNFDEAALLKRLEQMAHERENIAWQYLEQLPARTQDIIKNHLGLDEDGKRMTFHAIGITYNLSRQRIQQIYQKGIDEIKQKLGLNE